MPPDPQQKQPNAWGVSRPTTVSLAPVHTRAFEPPNQQQSYHAAPRFPNMTNHSAQQPITGSIVYADLSIARATPFQPNPNEMSPTEYAVLQFMNGGQEVQV